MEGSVFPSTSKNCKLGPTYPWLAIFYRQSNTFTRTAFLELSLHQKSPRLKQVLGSNMIPLITKFDTQMTVISHRRKERFSSSAGLLLRSEFSDRRHNTRVLEIRASCTFAAKILGRPATQPCYQSTLISGT